MFESKEKNLLSKSEQRKQTRAIIIMALLCLPILALYCLFFMNAFIDPQTGKFTLANFAFLYEEIKLSQYTVPPIGEAFKNTVFYAIIVTLLEVFISCLAGYALSRMEFKGKKVISFSLLALRLFPGMLLLIGVLYILIFCKIANTLPGVILVAIALRLPGSTFIIRNFFDNVPKDVESQALVDGCTRFSAFYQVILPMVKPGLASISLFAFMSAWSNYILFNTLIFTSKVPVLATYIRVLSRNDQMIADYGVFAAMALVYMIPVLIFFLTSQNQLMKSNLGGGKGL